MRNTRGTVTKVFTLIAALAMASLASGAAVAADVHSTGKFTGAKANAGTASHFTEGGKQVLKLSDDFVVPDTPAPHWQVVDSKGNVYLLNRLKIKGDKYNQQIALPAYVHDVAKVQIWCAWAETLLGEASFATPVMLAGGTR